MTCSLEFSPSIDFLEFCFFGTTSRRVLENPLEKSLVTHTTTWWLPFKIAPFLKRGWICVSHYGRVMIPIALVYMSVTGTFVVQTVSFQATTHYAVTGKLAYQGDLVWTRFPTSASPYLRLQVQDTYHMECAQARVVCECLETERAHRAACHTSMWFECHPPSLFVSQYSSRKYSNIRRYSISMAQRIA